MALAERAGGLVVDDAALQDLVARVGRMSDDLPQLAEVELRPVIAARTGLAVVGARVIVREPLRRVDSPVRRLLG